MPRRVSLPAADDLFRPTAPAGDADRRDPSGPPAEASEEPATRKKRPSGRVRHDEKMTVYITSDELLDELTGREAFGRAAEPWEVANVMVFLASDYSSYMTGEVVSVSSQRG